MRSATVGLDAPSMALSGVIPRLGSVGSPAQPFARFFFFGTPSSGSPDGDLKRSGKVPMLVILEDSGGIADSTRLEDIKNEAPAGLKGPHRKNLINVATQYAR